MNIFMAEMAFCFALFTIGMGTTLVIWSYRHDGLGIVGARAVGYFIAAMATMSLLCTTYNSIKYWEQGYFSPEKRMMQRQQGMQQHNMRQGMSDRMFNNNDRRERMKEFREERRAKRNKDRE